ncbi:zinc finger protein 410-like [Leguminivora glycinivorella]|uniref:zinc finger protein 410-like n=1 Tax=Leguminivora glycinivorella TaxID=1035111 RepID=UPI00200D8830|nr:zinc finger protein 410-like [Leguminivora glycinivorella]
MGSERSGSAMFRTGIERPDPAPNLLSSSVDALLRRTACFLTLATAAELSAHVLRHRQARQFVCGHDGCILRFGTRSNLMSHIRKCHGGAEEPREPDSTECEECGRTFASVAAMKRHARVHRNAQPDQPHAQAQEADDGASMLMMETEELEGEVEYLEVETLEDAELYSERKPQLSDLH